ncbi:hypothetical protein IGK74_002373 [Enterococcus sp. AZ150]|uniref:hypothetical protein n=1 Tax=Enterococcus sp. AZ150 TaxID=2774866 RepID=UPI003F248387
MSKQYVSYNIKGIKCDACDFKDMSIEVEKYPEWLNKPCPKCGANLLTQEDLDSVNRMIAAVDMTNKLLESLNVEIPDNSEETRVKVDMDGTGIVNMELAEDEE